MSNLVTKQATLNSRVIAEMIGIRHKEILRKLEGAKDRKGYITILAENQMVTSDYFILSTYNDESGKENKCYEFTKMGCEFIANKFTGEKGALFTAKYVQAFNKMEKYIQNNFSINEFKGQITTLVNELFEEKLSDVKEYYKIKAQSKVDLSTYIKKRLGILRADDEYDQVKTRVFLLLGISKWEDLDINSYKSILPIIDESIRVIKMDRPQQASMWD